MATALAPVSIPRRCRAAVLTTLDELGGEGSRHEILARAKRIAGFTREELRLLAVAVDAGAARAGLNGPADLARRPPERPPERGTRP